MGQLPPMDAIFEALGTGLVVAVFLILVLLTAYFESPRLALISIGAVPGVLAGIATILFLTGTGLNIESFMGSIMCPGVSVSNSVMLVTFIDQHWRGNVLGRGGGARRERTPAADSDDGLRDDRRDGVDGAGLAVGFWRDPEELRSLWQCDRVWQTGMAAARREQLYRRWRNAVSRTFGWLDA